MQALTIEGSGTLKVLQSEIGICAPIIDKTKGPDRTITCIAIWDTGASGSVITQRVADDLGIKPIGMTNVETANGTTISPVYLVDFILPNRVIIQGLRVTLGKLSKVDALIGMDLISIGDFSITNVNKKTKMSFRTPSMVEIDYVKEAEVAIKKPINRQARRRLAREQAKKLFN